MDIVEASPQRLLLRTSSRTVVWGTLAAAAMLFIGCLIAFLVARTVSVRCERRAPDALACDATERWLGFVPVRSRHFEGVRRAASGYTGDPSDPSCRVELETASGHHPLSSLTSAEWQTRAFVRRFNESIAGGRNAAAFTQWPDPLGLPVLPVPFVIAAFLFLLARPRSIDIDARRSVLTIRAGLARTRWPLREIAEILVEQKGGESGTTARVFLRTTRGNTAALPVTQEQAALIKNYLPAAVLTLPGQARP
ncbi:MAG: hypothetical protein JW940_31810 [Polyangiaceae bacterium]|nr:hypothetical protein [Polyangiaceae bacterium]